MATLLRAALPFPAIPIVQPKLAHLRERADEYDTLFLGSSRVYHQIIPAQFDRATAEQGMPTRSFNLGIDGMRAPEDAYVLDHFLAMKPQRLRWVFVELAGIRLEITKGMRGSIRAAYWHDLDRTELVIHRAFSSERDYGFARQLEETWSFRSEIVEHAQLFLQRLANAGRAEWLTRLLKGEPVPAISRKAVGPASDGYLLAAAPQQMRAAETAAYRKALAQRKEEPATGVWDRASLRALRRMLKKIAASGATPVLIVPPTTAKKNFKPEADAGVVVLDYSDIERYATLYEEPHRADREHLNEAGAVVFTQLLAADFIGSFRKTAQSAEDSSVAPSAPAVSYSSQ